MRNCLNIRQILWIHLIVLVIARTYVSRSIVFLQIIFRKIKFVIYKMVEKEKC